MANTALPMPLVAGLLAAQVSRYKDGRGAVVEISIFEGTVSLMTMLYSLTDAGVWQTERNANIDLDRQHDRDYWPIMEQEIARCMKKRTRDDWDTLFVNTDCCCTPVLNIDEARGPAGMATFFKNGIPVPPITFKPG